MPIAFFGVKSPHNNLNQAINNKIIPTITCAPCKPEIMKKVLPYIPSFIL